MANRSNRRQLNPRMTACLQHEKAIGNWRANKPLWPGINVCHLEGRIYVRSRAYVIKQSTCIEEESIYGRSDHGKPGNLRVRYPPEAASAAICYVAFCYVSCFFEITITGSPVGGSSSCTDRHLDSSRESHSLCSRRSFRTQSGR